MNGSGNATKTLHELIASMQWNDQNKMDFFKRASEDKKTLSTQDIYNGMKDELGNLLAIFKKISLRTVNSPNESRMKEEELTMLYQRIKLAHSVLELTHAWNYQMSTEEHLIAIKNHLITH